MHVQSIILGAGLIINACMAAPLTVQVKIDTCGSHFVNLDYECNHAGLVGAKDPNFVCPQSGCTLPLCCKFTVPQLTPQPQKVPQMIPVPQQVPQKIPVPQKVPVPQQIPVPQKAPPAPRSHCAEYFDHHGKQICSNNGYAHRRNSSTQCRGAHCKIDECCKDKKPTTCADYFDKNGKQMCTKNGYEHRRNSSTECQGKNCKIDECCKNPKPQYTTIENEFGYIMCKNGRYFEWQHRESCSKANTLSFIENTFPQGTDTQLQTPDDKCLVIVYDNNFPSLALGSCTHPAHFRNRNGNSIRISDKIGVCKSNGGFKRCPASQSGPVCIGDDEGYVALRPCSRHTKAKF
eukprot:Awhi_evm1s8881